MIIQFRRAAGVGEGTTIKIYLPRLIGRVEIDDDEMQPLVGSAGEKPYSSSKMIKT